MHLNVLIGEEVRLIKKADWDSIAMPMIVTRQPGFRSRPEYIDRIDLDDDAKVITITSNRFKNEWFNTFFNNTFVNYFKNKYNVNRIFAVDIFPALKYGLKKVSWYFQQKKEMDELSFRMEILNETVGEVDGAYFTHEMLSKNQLLTEPFYPQTIDEYINGTWKPFRNKYPEEFRMISVDFAFANGSKNDNTSIECISVYPREDEWLINLDYLETLGGGEGDEALLHIREMFWDYHADYIIMDLRSGGEVHYNSLTKEFEHPVRTPEDWNSHGFTVCDDEELQLISKEKYNDLVNRTNDQHAIPCIIPILGSLEFNSLMWMELKHNFRINRINLLEDTLDYEQGLGVETLKMTVEERAFRKAPFVQTMLLVNEAINLTATYKPNGTVSLSEGSNPNNTKDRIVSFGYGNYIANRLINKTMRDDNRNADFDFSDYSLIV